MMSASMRRRLTAALLVGAAMMACKTGMRLDPSDGAGGTPETPAGTAAKTESATEAKAEPAAAAESAAKEEPVEEASVAKGTCVDSECHTQILEEPELHSAAETCTDCHVAPASHPDMENPAKLTQELPALCTECHTDVADTVNEAANYHAAMDAPESCALCHNPHSSPHKVLMQKPQRELCADCHDDVIKLSNKVLHGKDKDGKCSDCHEAHGGGIEGLLVAEFPSAAYVPYGDKAYPLCFKCHDRKAFEAAETADATRFRDGNRNLHHLHVNKTDKGRSCRLCHNVHGTVREHLIAEVVEFGKWDMSIKFQATATGGGCGPGCHKPLYYDREQPGRRPSGAVASR